jgi:transposase
MKALATWAPAPFLDVTAVEREDSRWLVTVFSRERACCPVCGVQSRSRHSVYSSTLSDLSAQGTPVTIRVRVGRWRCRNEQCDRQIFAERLPGIGASARQADRLTEIVRLFGHSAGGRPSARLLARLGMRVSHTTILPRLKQHVRPKVNRSAIRVAGVDEWAWRKGTKFGTIVETGRLCMPRSSSCSPIRQTM